jgi:hypothetical protein
MTAAGLGNVHRETSPPNPRVTISSLEVDPDHIEHVSASKPRYPSAAALSPRAQAVF